MKLTSKKKIFVQIVGLLFLSGVFIIGYFLVLQILELPFRTANDTLHKNESIIVLDFLIPAGMYIREENTIGEVVQMRYNKHATLYEKSLKHMVELIPDRYRYVANVVLFLFWTFLYMTFLRVFTFMGYGRAVRISLFTGGCTYYFMPDFSQGRVDDILFFNIALAIIITRYYLKARKKRMDMKKKPGDRGQK